MELPAGVSAGHWTDPVGRTGCTVVLAPGGGVAGVDVRGAAPGTLGTDALRPGMLVERAQAILLTGGSAFGLAAADGIMRYLDERGAGYQIGPVRVPIVAGAVIFDLLNGDPRARPDADAGYSACRDATRHPGAGRVGAGTGATVAKAGGGTPGPGGLGVASEAVGGAVVAAIMVANSAGGIWDDERHEWVAPLAPGSPAAAPVAGGMAGIPVSAGKQPLSPGRGRMRTRGARRGPRRARVAVDATGLAQGAVSTFFVRRMHHHGQKPLPWRHWLKWVVVADRDQPFLLSQSARRGPWNDCGSLPTVVETASEKTSIGLVLADAEFDSERNHTYIRQRLGARSVIPAKRGKKTWRVRGVRAEMRRAFPRELYPRRALIETGFSSVKRKLSARAPRRSLRVQIRQALLLGLSFNLYRLRHRYLFLRMSTEPNDL